MVYQCEKRSKQNIICDRFNHIPAILLLTSYLLPLTSYFLPLTSYFLPLTSYFCLTKFAQRGEPPFGFSSLLKSGNPPNATASPQRTDKPHNDNFALLLTSYLLLLTSYLLLLTSYFLLLTYKPINSQLPPTYLIRLKNAISKRIV